MGVEPPAADDIASGRMEDGGAMAGRQRAGQQDGAADPSAQSGIQSDGVQAPGAEGDGMAALTNVHAQPGQQPQHVFDIENPGHVLERDGFVGQDAGGQHGQHGVLVAERRKGSADPAPPLDDQPRHDRSPTPP